MAYSYTGGYVPVAQRHFTSDWHFGHKRIIELADRPFFNVDDMDFVLIRNWNARVKMEDTGFVLGDVALGPIMESLSYVEYLMGTKIMITGNHDRNFAGGKRSGGKEPHEWDDVYREVGFSEVLTSHQTILSNGSTVNLSHFPYDGDSHDGDRFGDYRLKDEGVILLHGHTHSHEAVSRSKNGTLQINVGVDAWKGFPASEGQITNLIRENA